MTLSGAMSKFYKDTRDQLVGLQCARDENPSSRGKERSSRSVKHALNSLSTRKQRYYAKREQIITSLIRGMKTEFDFMHAA